MGLYDMSPVPKVLNTRGIVGVDRIASMSFSTINKLTYKDTDDQSNKSLNAGMKQLLKIFVMYTHRLTDDNLLPEDWNSNTIDASGFRRFRMSHEPHTRINCIYNNTDYKEVVTSALIASQTGINPTGATTGSNPTHPINVCNKHTTQLSE
jgi:hypothetical protein